MTESSERFRLKKVITLGDMLTPISVLVSVVALWLTWYGDSNLKKKQYADQVRHSASVVTAKMERWGAIADLYFDDLQSPIVEASQSVETNHKREPANRELYKGLMNAKEKASERIINEQLEGAYIDLYGYVPSLRKTFDDTIERVKAAEKHAHAVTEINLQEKLADPSLLQLTSSIYIGNPLRDEVLKQREDLQNQIEQIVTPLREKMLGLIELSDDEILEESKREAVMQGRSARIRR